MQDILLEIKNLTVSIEEKSILKGLSLTIPKNEVHVILGPNGAGKSTLGNAIMGNPEYQVESGTISFEGEEITKTKVDERAKKGIFLSFQTPAEVPGVSLYDFIRTAQIAKGREKSKAFAFHKEIKEMAKLLNMDEAYVTRELNVGFSGGEKKKAEILQLLMLSPKLAILDETDSGLDVDAVKIVSQGVEMFKEGKENSLLIITHNTKILEQLKVDAVHILVDGKIVKDGDASLIDYVNEHGFDEYYVIQ